MPQAEIAMDVFQDGTIKYAFLDTAKENVLDADGYMNWDNGPDWFKSKYLTEEDVGICRDNIKTIEEEAVLMTRKEVDAFLDYDYTPFVLKVGEKR